MTTPLRLVFFGLVLAVAFGVAWGAGAALGEPTPPAPTSHSSSRLEPHRDDHRTEETSSAQAADLPGGLMVAQSGYRLDLPTRMEPGQGRGPAFRILQSDGRPLSGFAVPHDRRPTTTPGARGGDERHGG